MDYIISPPFDRNDTTYNISIPFSVTNLYARGLAEEMNGNIFWNGIAQPRYGYSQGITTKNGTNLLQAYVLATDDESFIVYDLYVTKAQPSNVPTLQTLFMTKTTTDPCSTADEQVDFAEPFYPDNYTYTKTFSFTVSQIQFNGVSDESYAQIDVLVGGVVVQEIGGSGGRPASASMKLDLAVGVTVFTVRVTAQDESTKNMYVASITRETASMATDLVSVIVTGVWPLDPFTRDFAMTPAFNRSTSGPYVTKGRWSQYQVTVTVQAAGDIKLVSLGIRGQLKTSLSCTRNNVTFTLNRHVLLDPPIDTSNILEILTVAQDLQTRQTYVFDMVIMAASSDANIAGMRTAMRGDPTIGVFEPVIARTHQELHHLDCAILPLQGN